jgi:hypothetical protein
VRKILDYLVWFFVSITIIVMMGTIAITYRMAGYIKIFSNYQLFDLSLAVTMLFLGFKMYALSKGRKKIYYSLMCFFLSLCSIFFMINNVQ